MQNPTTKRLVCQGFDGCTETALMIGNKGYVYCCACGPVRRASGYEQVRALKPAEIKRLQAGEALSRY